MAEDVSSVDTALPGPGPEQAYEPISERSLAADDSADFPSADPQESSAALRFAAAAEELGREIGNLREELAKGHARAEAREKTIDRLHAEVERLRAGETRLLLRPVIADLRRLRDDLITQARALAGASSEAKPAPLLESFADSVEYTLERCGVTVVRPVQDAPCDPAEHHVTGFAPTDDGSLDGRIMKIVSDGYRDEAGARLIAPARVIAYRASAGAAPREDAQPGDVPAEPYQQ